MPDRDLAAEGLTREEQLREALEALYGMAINGVVCDPHHDPCDLCAAIFKRVVAALDGAALASEGPSLSLPAEPSEEAVKVSRGLLNERLFHVPARHMFAALRAAYKVDS